MVALANRLVTSEVIQRALIYAAEEMGIALRNSAYSPNIKERMDHSCAIFDGKRRLVAQAEHIPVHLGSMGLALNKGLESFEGTLEEGDMLLFNDPYVSGTHLPDLTLIAPIFFRDEVAGYACNKAHHSDVGGKVPGSIAVDAKEFSEEGLVIPAVKLIANGKLDHGISNWIKASVRVPEVTMGDLRAQVAANITGVRRFLQLVEKYGLNTVEQTVEDSIAHSERLVSAEIRKMPGGNYNAEDYIEGPADRPIRLKVEVIVKGEGLRVDYTGTDEQVKWPINAVWGVTLSGIYYVVKCLTDSTIPANEGCYNPIEAYAPEGTVLNPKKPAPVAGGNVETSQRNADLLLKAFAEIVPEKVTAASQGTMNNVAMGGLNPKTGRQWAYYETVAGGMGGRLGIDGIDGIHTNMTNTMNTPIEALEKICPIRFVEHRFREDSCGAGKWRGGLGLTKSWVATAPMTVTVMSTRRTIPPWGLFGGKEGACGETSIVRRNGRALKLKPMQTVQLEPGDAFILKTPGGGGYGDPSARDGQLVVQDVLNEMISPETALRNY